MNWISQPAYEEGYLQGSARSLIRFLQGRFGPLPDSIRQQIRSADLPTILAWVDVSVDAPDLQSLLDRPVLSSPQPTTDRASPRRAAPILNAASRS